MAQKSRIYCAEYTPGQAIIAFKNFSPMEGSWGSPWGGFSQFIAFFHSYYFWRLLVNTFLISFYTLIFGFPADHPGAAPQRAASRGMIGARELAWMQDGALLVNTARAPIVDTAALLAEVRSGRISAAVDVYEQEPLDRDHELLRYPNVLCEPHVGGFSS